MKYTIYKITNTINGKVYIGKHQTKDLDDGYMGSGKNLRRSIKKHGIENFTKEILHVFDNESEMNDKEAELVTEKFCARDDTYNICVGGQGGFSYINQSGLSFGGDPVAAGKKSRKICDAFLLEKYGPSFRSVITNRTAMILGLRKYYSDGNTGHFLGKKHTEDTKLKIGMANKTNQKGEKNSQFGSCWITNGTENKKIKAIDAIPDGWYRGRVKEKGP